MKPPLRPLPPPIHDCAYGALITFDCAYGAFITLGANATTCRRQSIIYKYPSINPSLRLSIRERRQTNPTRLKQQKPTCKRLTRNCFSIAATRAWWRWVKSA